MTTARLAYAYCEDCHWFESYKRQETADQALANHRAYMHNSPGCHHG